MPSRKFCIVLLLAVATSIAAAQAAPTYDVSTVKPHAAGDGDSSVSWHEATYLASNVDLKHLIASAYGVRDWLIFGLPKWAESSNYDVSAKASEADPDMLKRLSIDECRAMLGGLLRERFGLVMHQEDKLQPVYELSVVPEGIRLHATPPPPMPEDGTPLQKPGSRWSIHNGELTATAMTMHALSDNLSYVVERNVVDETGLTGVYDFVLRFTPANRVGADNGLSADAPPDIFTAMKEQLGLKLTPAKAPVPTVVIDHIEQPQAN